MNTKFTPTFCHRFDYFLHHFCMPEKVKVRESENMFHSVIFKKHCFSYTNSIKLLFSLPIAANLHQIAIEGDAWGNQTI